MLTWNLLPIELHLTSPDVMQRIKDKQTYILENPETDIAEENAIEKWTTFLPILHRFHIPSVENITEDYRKMLISDFKSGSPDQRMRISVIRGKMLAFSASIQEHIQNILDKHKMMHTESVNTEFFTDNEYDSEIAHFIKLDCDIDYSIKAVNVLSKIDYDVKALSRGSILFCDVNTKNVFAPMKTEFGEETIYKAFINICKFDRQQVPSEYFLPICGTSRKN